MKISEIRFLVKTTLVLTFWLASIYIFGVWAQSNNVKIHLYSSSRAGLSYERAVNHFSSISVGCLLAKKKYRAGLFSNNVSYSHTGFRLMGDFRIYVSQKDEKLSGLYCGLNGSIGRHQVNYQRLRGLGGIDTFFFILGLLTANEDYIAGAVKSGESKTIVGEAKVIASSVGLKFGWQKQWDIVSLDMGANFKRNSALNSTRGIPLNTGKYQAYRPDIKGSTVELYFGMGIAF